MGDAMKVYDKEMSRDEIERHCGDLSALGGVRLVTLADGAERGVRVLEFRLLNSLRFEVLVDRAMDIGVAEFDGKSFSWRSPTGFRHPGLHEANDEGGFSWFRSMSGLLVTAGLDHILFGSDVDASNYHYAARPTIRHGLHGRVANIPARLTGYGETWVGDRCVLWAEGEVRQAAVFGEHLRLSRRVEADLDGSELRLYDSVRNYGFDPTPHMYLYHVNLGWPLVDAGTRFEAPLLDTVWASESAAIQGVSRFEIAPPKTSFVEQVYEHRLGTDDRGKTIVAVINSVAGLRFELEYEARAFPTFFEWLNLREGAYAIGLEPSTHNIGGEPAARSEGSLIWLKHGDAKTYSSVFRFLRA
jgi:Domain of unknown function (DUF4432)